MLPQGSSQGLPARLSPGEPPCDVRASTVRNLCVEVELVTVSSTSAPSSATQGPAKWRDKIAEIARTVFSLARHPAGALVSLWRHLLGTRVFAVYAKDGPAEEEVLEGLLPVAPSGSCCCLLRDLAASVDDAGKGPDRGADTCVRGKPEDAVEAQEAKPAASEKALEAYVEMSDWALESSGATIDRQRTSETYSCKENWGCRALWFFRTAKPPETILQPDVSPGNCWPLQGHQGQVVIRLPARVHPTAVTVQHIYKDVSPSGTVISAPRDVAVFGVEADGEEETLLGTFTYNVAKEAIQTFPLKNAPLPRAFLYIKLLVKSNWGNPAYTCIYRVQVHGKMAQPESLS
ncbi:SUN domain-containing protein 2-like [Morus bassanus]